MSLLWILAQASLVAFGVWWCAEMIPRYRQDMATLREGDSSDRAVIIMLWLATAVIVVLLIAFGLRLLRRILGGLE